MYIYIYTGQGHFCNAGQGQLGVHTAGQGHCMPQCTAGQFLFHNTLSVKATATVYYGSRSPQHKPWSQATKYRVDHSAAHYGVIQPAQFPRWSLSRLTHPYLVTSTGGTPARQPGSRLWARVTHVLSSYCCAVSFMVVCIIAFRGFIYPPPPNQFIDFRTSTVLSALMVVWIIAFLGFIYPPPPNQFIDFRTSTVLSALMVVCILAFRRFIYLRLPPPPPPPPSKSLLL